jgi:hypothetical protein
MSRIGELMDTLDIPENISTDVTLPTDIIGHLTSDGYEKANQRVEELIRLRRIWLIDEKKYIELRDEQLARPLVIRETRLAHNTQMVIYCLNIPAVLTYLGDCSVDLLIKVFEIFQPRER